MATLRHLPYNGIEERRLRGQILIMVEDGNQIEATAIATERKATGRMFAALTPNCTQLVLDRRESRATAAGSYAQR